MKYAFWIMLMIVAGLFSCGGEQEPNEVNLSKNEFGPYFYPYDTVPKVYVYRDLVSGLEEEFHRVFSINDSEGKHIVVEVYKSDGRITEALNYGLDSLLLIDHMVVDRNLKNTKAELFKNKLIPASKTDKASFVSRFSGISDSTLFLKEVDRIYSKTKDIDIMGKKVSAVVFDDHVRLTLFNPFSKQENVANWEMVNYFAKGYGLVEWHTPNRDVHYRLEKIIPQDEFVNLMSNL